jgi:small-conductance mechanosensitive channel
MRSPFVFIAILVAALLAGLVTPMTPDGGAARAQLLGYGSLTGGGAKPAEDDAEVETPSDPDLAAYGDLGDFSAGSMIDRTTQGVGVFRQRLDKTFERLPFAIEEMRATLSAASLNGEPSYFIGVLLVTVLLLLIGRAVVTLVAIYVFQPILVGAQIANPIGIVDKLPVLALRMGLTLIGVLIVVAVTVGLGLFFVIDHEPTQKTAAVIVVAYAAIFMVDTAWRMVISPYLPKYRIPRFSDGDARRLYHWMSAGVAIGVTSQAFSFWMRELNLPPETHALITVALSLATVILIEAMIWRNRRAITGAILGGAPRNDATWPARAASMLWAPLTMLYFVVAWVENSVRLILGLKEGVQLLGGAFLALMVGLICYVVIVYIVERAFARLRQRDEINRQAAAALRAEAERAAGAPERATLETLSGEGDDGGDDGDDEGGSATPVIPSREGAAPTPQPPRPGMRSFEDLGRRVASLFALGAAAYTLVRVWGGQAVLEEGTTVNTVGDIVDTMLVGYIIYHAARIWMDQKIAAETVDEAEAELGDEGGGASAATRLATLLPLFRSFVLLSIVVTIVLLIATDLGVNVAPLFAGAGIVGLAIGFGAQTLVRDILSGVFFLMDDAFRKGEYIDVGDVKGTVEKISLRSFQLRHHLGALHTIPFGEIKHLTNFSRDWVMMKLPLRLTYDTDVEQVRKLIKKLGQELLDHPVEGQKFVQPLKSQGVYMMEDSAMIFRVKYMTRPGDQWTTRKLVYARIREVFEEHGIKFAHKEVTVRIPDLPEGGKLSAEQKQAVGAAARRAVEEVGEEQAGAMAIEGR